MVSYTEKIASTRQHHPSFIQPSVFAHFHERLLRKPEHIPSILTHRPAQTHPRNQPI